MTANLTSVMMTLTALAMASGTAQAAEWVVSKVNPPAQYSADSETWHSLSIGSAVPDTVWVRTGERGMLLLEKDSDSILFKPGSLAQITSEFEGRAGTSITQRSGALLLDVRKHDRPHTQVRTPFLGAVVKGTKFETRVGRWDAELEVQRGVVEVTHIRRGERIDLLAGQTARVGESAAVPIVFFGSSGKPEADWIQPREPIVLPLEVHESPGRWGSNASEQAWLWLGGVSKVSVGIAMAVLAALILGVLMIRKSMSMPQGSTGSGEDSVPDVAEKTRDRPASDDGLSSEGVLTTGLVATFSACIVGLVAIAMPGFRPVSVLAAMAVAVLVLLLILRLSPSRNDS